MSTSIQKNALLARYLVQLTTHPLRTKAITSAILYGLQEALASHLARVPVEKRSNEPLPVHILARAHLNAKSLKMAIYGGLVAAPLSHFLVGLIQKAFAGQTGVQARLGQLLAHNLLVSPVQVLAYLVSVSIINGAQNIQQVKSAVKTNFWRVLRLTWIVSPTSIVLAQRFVPPDLWVPFFNLVQFVLGTLSGVKAKQALLKKQKDKASE